MPQGSILVTGGNAGIGYAIAAALAETGRHVAILSRDEERGASAAARIRATVGRPVEVIVGDLSTLDGAVQVADRVRTTLPRLAVLVHNAGVWATRRQMTPDGLELSFTVNHLAPLILSAQLYELLAANGPARIVALSAGLYRLGRVDLERTPEGADFHPMRTYASTKLWGLLGVFELARRLASSRITVNAVHPGIVRTGLGEMGGVPGAMLRVVKRFWATPEQGADAPVWLATAPKLEEVTGRFFDRRQETAPDGVAGDPVIARQVWERSSELVGQHRLGGLGERGQD